MKEEEEVGTICGRKGSVCFFSTNSHFSSVTLLTNLPLQ